MRRRSFAMRDAGAGTTPRAPAHFGCAQALRSHLTGCEAPGCAPVRDTGPRAARHPVRRDARAWAQPKWKQDLAGTTAFARRRGESREHEEPR